MAQRGTGIGMMDGRAMQVSGRPVVLSQAVLGQTTGLPADRSPEVVGDSSGTSRSRTGAQTLG